MGYEDLLPQSAQSPQRFLRGFLRDFCGSLWLNLWQAHEISHSSNLRDGSQHQ